jgi:hypothetical protein
MKYLIISSPQFIPIEQSSLLTNENISAIVDGKYHTSIVDISVNNLLLLAKVMDVIEFVDFENSAVRIKTLTVLNHISNSKTIKNFIPIPPSDFLDISVNRLSDPMIWVFGCSFSHGRGVLTSEKYSSILGERLDKKVLSITKPGSSTRWSLRHLMNAEFNEGDLVVWQITTFSRISLATDSHTLSETVLKSAPKNVIMGISDDQLYIDQLSLLNYGVQYLRSKKVKFVIISLDSQDSFSDQLQLEYSRYPEYLYMGEWLVDKGSDDSHPGKLSHKLVAESILNIL